MTPMSINYDKVIMRKEYSSATRLLAAQLRGNPMMLVSSFYKELSDNELEELRVVSEHSIEDEISASEIILLTLMLTSAEGTSALTEEELHRQMIATKIFITTAYLHRYGLATANFDSFSYGSDMENEVIALPTELGKELADKLSRRLSDEDYNGGE